MNIENFFTVESISSLGVAAAMVTVTANTLYKIANIPQKYTAFIAGLVIAYGHVYIREEITQLDWILAFFNACLLFCTAMGMNNLGDQITRKPVNIMATEDKSKRRFFCPWLNRYE